MHRLKHKSKPMPIYCVVMSDVKQESLANAKVRISTQQQCIYEGHCLSEEIYSKYATNITLTWKVGLHSVAKDEGIVTLFLIHSLTQISNGSIISLFHIFQYLNCLFVYLIILFIWFVDK